MSVRKSSIRKKPNNSVENTRKRVIGATRAPEKIKGNKNIRKVLKIIVIVALIGTFAAKIDFKAQIGKVNAVANRPVAQISIEGKFKYISRGKVRALLEQHVNDNFVDIDLKVLKQGIEKNPWVETAAVSRVWPDKLIVKIDEQMAIARWGTGAFINRFGEKISVPDNSVLSNLPLLSGPEEMAKDIASRYFEVSSLLRDTQLSLTGVDVDETKSWVFNFSGSKALYIGKTDILGKMDLFLMVYDQYLGRSLQKIKKVDMRYESGLAVEWVDQQEAVASLSASGRYGVYPEALLQKVARH